MKCASALALLVTLLAAPARAQAAGDGGPATAAARRAERTLLQLEEEWARAVVRRDGAAFRRLLDPRFVYTENERVMTKEELVREVVSGSDTVRTATNEDVRTYVHGMAAVVVGILRLQGRGAGGPFDRRFRFTDTWAFRGGRWRVIAAQDYLLPR
jgi:ketosteroid isomerase-like protein